MIVLPSIIYYKLIQHDPLRIIIDPLISQSEITGNKCTNKNVHPWPWSKGWKTK